jgi:hypothetical protein
MATRRLSSLKLNIKDLTDSLPQISESLDHKRLNFSECFSLNAEPIQSEPLGVALAALKNPLPL